MRRIFWLTLGASAALLACRAAETVAETPAETPANPQTAKLIFGNHTAGVPVTGRIPDFQLRDQDGRVVTGENYFGKIWLVNIINTQCGARCELQTEVMTIVQDALKSAPIGKNVAFATVTANPQTDTPAVLSGYSRTRNIDTRNRKFLTGSRAAVAGFLKDGLSLSPSAAGVMTQTDAFYLIDQEGRVRGQYVATKPDGFAAMKSAMIKVAAERVNFPENLGESFIDPRAATQAERAKTLDVFHNFKFENRAIQSGISFRHKIVDDLGRSAIAVHYDHGNALAIADVDLDGLTDVYFTSLTGTNELWRNLGSGKFENITDKSGLTLTGRIGMGASFADIDNDGDPDLYITNVREGNVLYENDGKGNFKDITKRSGTLINAHSSSATFFDYDSDGLLDLFVTNVGSYTTEKFYKTSQYGDYGQYLSEEKYWVGFKDAFGGHLKPERAEASVLFKNLGNSKFKDVTKTSGLVTEGWNGEATVIDANNDGRPDLYIADMQGNDAFFENINGKTFARKDRAVFDKTPWGAMGAKAFDYDNDGDADLYVTDMHSDMRKDIPLSAIANGAEKLKAVNDAPEVFLRSGGKSLFGNAFYRNNGKSRFSEISDSIGVETYWPWGPSTGDFNADGFEDIFVAGGMGYPYRYSVNSVLLNDRGRGFVDSEFMLGVEPRKSGVATPWFEIDCAGASKGHIACPKTGRPRRHTVWAAQSSRSAAVFDLDNDGDQDIVTLEFNQRPMVLINNLSDQKPINFLKINLDGTRSNKSGIGAVVKVYAGDNVYTKSHDGKSGYLAQSSAPLYFGLGEATRADKIEVKWPSGRTQTLTSPAQGETLITITEPK